MQYEKPFATFDDQVDLLLSRGMQGDKAVIRDHLVDVGYYRLIGSFALLPFSAIYLKILPPTPLGEEGYSNCLRNIRISIKG